jgi:hypothetical protein
MATFNKVNDWVEYFTEAVNAGSDQFVVALSNTAPASETSNPASDGNGVIANVTQVSYTNCSSRNVTTASSAQTSGTQNISLTDLTLTASGGTVGPFRYVYLYDDTVAGDPIVGYWDYGSSITLNDTETLDIDFAANTLTVT